MNNLGLIILITVLIFSTLTAVIIAKKDLNPIKLLYRGSFVWACLIILIAKFYPEKAYTSVNFIPFVKMFEPNGGEYMLEFVLSALLFFPLGFLLCVYAILKDEQLMIIKIAMFCMIIASVTELLQLVPLGKLIATDHIIANTLGAIFGSVVLKSFSLSPKVKELLEQINY